MLKETWPSIPLIGDHYFGASFKHQKSRQKIGQQDASSFLGPLLSKWPLHDSVGCGCAIVKI